MDVKWLEVQMIWLSTWLKLWSYQKKAFCETSFTNGTLKLKNEAFLRDFLQNWSCEAQKRSFSARLPSKLKLWRSKTKHFCETSFKIEAVKLKKQSFSARLPSKMQLWSSKTKHFCETSFKIEALKLKNEAFLRDFLQNASFRDEKRSFSAGLPSKTKLWRSKTKLFCGTSSKTKFWRSKTKLFCETSFKNDMSTRHLTSQFQYVLMIFKWMLQKYCACHEKVEPRHTNSCNCHAKWSLPSNTSVTWNLQPFHGFCVEGFKHQHHKARNHCACHAKRILSEPLQIHHACHRFCNPHELLRLPRILQCVAIPAPATRNTPPKTSRTPGVLTILTSESFARAGVVQILRSSTSKSAPNLPRFNDFDFQIALARRRGANFVDVNFQKCSDTASF